jgi:iron complex transport system permease protein
LSSYRAGRNPGQQPVTGFPQRRRRIYAIIGLLAALGGVIVFATALGSVQIPFATTTRVLLDGLPGIDIPSSWLGATETIILSGAALSIAGATYQGLFRNPLADPYLIGVTQGAALGAVIGFTLPFQWQAMGFGIIPLLAFTGALVTVFIVYNLARVGKTIPVTTLILAGVALGALCASIVSYLIITSGEKMHGIVFWLMGSFSLSEWSEVRVVLPYVITGVVIILLYARSLNVMQLDEEQAQQLGVDVEKVKRILLGAATLITAAAVSFVGTIGFVGIIMPHIVRLIWGPDYRFLLPLSLLSGGVFLILADLVARTALAPMEIPVGVITAICGAPFFLYILRRKRRQVFF